MRDDDGGMGTLPSRLHWRKKIDLPRSLSRRSFLLLMFLSACAARSTSSSMQGRGLMIGTVSYGGGQQMLGRFDRFKQYLEEKMQSLVQIEPALNETRAIERIKRKAWDLAFVPPGLAAIAISQHQYLPLFPLSGVTDLRSVFVVRRESDLQDLNSLSGQKIALGKPGSATGYYLPIYNLYGLTIEEFLFLPTPKAILEAVAQVKAAAGALSMGEFETHRRQIDQTEFRILYTDPHPVPTGAVLVGPTIERNEQESLRRVLSETPAALADEAGFVPNGTPPNYDYMFSVVQQVSAIFPLEDEERKVLTQRPLRLFKGNP